MSLMGARILITGGAGFIGSHLADELLDHGYHVRILDRLSAQVHTNGHQRPEYLNRDVETVWGDLRDPETTHRAVRDIDAVYHFAAAVGVGQSMYAIEDYTSHNHLGTAVLLEALVKHPVERLVVASSMSIYGEGLYRSGTQLITSGVERSMVQLRASVWEPVDNDGNILEPVATPESKPPALSSVYALSKYVQERMCLMIGRAYNIPTVALRFFNVYGPRQSLSNPYTGVLAIFASRYLNGSLRLSSKTAGRSVISLVSTILFRLAVCAWRSRVPWTKSSILAAVRRAPSADSPSSWRAPWAVKASSRTSAASTEWEMCGIASRTFGALAISSASSRESICDSAS